MYHWCDSKSVYVNICSFRIFETSKLIRIRYKDMNLGFNLKKKKKKIILCIFKSLIIFFKFYKKMNLCPVSITPMISGGPTYFKPL